MEVMLLLISGPFPLKESCPHPVPLVRHDPPVLEPLLYKYSGRMTACEQIHPLCRSAVVHKLVHCDPLGELEESHSPLRGVAKNLELT